MKEISEQEIIHALYTKYVIGEKSLFELLEDCGFKDYAVQSIIDKLAENIKALQQPTKDKEQ